MYAIQVNTRRVTKFMVNEAYAWLYRRIVAGEYNANGCKEGKALLIRIQTEQAVTAETYDRFLELFDSSPVHRLTYQKKWNKGKQITADKLENYFVSYNDRVLPIGFVQEFFEDDYETRQEIEAMLADFCKQDNNENSLNWRGLMLELDEKIDQLTKFYPGALKPHPLLLVTRIIYAAITIAILVLILSFLGQVRFFDIMTTFAVENKFDANVAMTLDEALGVYYVDGEVFCQAGERFMLSDYMSAYGSFFLFNLALFFIVLGRLKKTLQFLSYLCSVVVDNLKIVFQRISIRSFEKKGVGEMQAYFESISAEMVQEGCITEAMFRGVPAARKNLTFLARFDMQKAVDSLQKRHTKYKKYKFAYDADKKQEAMRSWRKGMVFSVLVLVIVLVLDVPAIYHAIAPTIIDFFATIT